MKHALHTFPLISAILLFAACLVFPDNAFAKPRIELVDFDPDADSQAADAGSDDISEGSDGNAGQANGIQPDQDTRSPITYIEQPVVAENPYVKGHGFQLGLTFLGIPGYILDNWFTTHGNVWENGAVNMGYSFDYILRFRRPCEMRFSLSWVNGQTGDAYWLDKFYANRPQLADYVVQNYSVIALEVAAYHVINIVDAFDFYYGGGGWIGAIVGDAKMYAISSKCATSTDDLSVCRHEPGAVPLTQMPPVMGFAILTLGFKYTFADLITLRAEGGFKGYFFGQLGVGVEF